METTTTKMKFKKGDEVIVIAGKDKGKVGAIAKVSPSTNRVLVTGVNLVKRAVKPNPQTGEEGGIIAKESPIHASNVAFNAGGKPSRKRPA
jgi:large subunit ribosomal protein L24